MCMQSLPGSLSLPREPGDEANIELCRKAQTMADSRDFTLHVLGTKTELHHLQDQDRATAYP